MRAFMRAIGLGGLFKHSASAAKPHSARRVSTGRAAMGILVPVEDIHLMMPEQPSTIAGRLSRARSRESSVYERPQFLFFCGSDNSGVAAARRTGYQSAAADSDFSFQNADVQARASTKSPTIQAPTISHRIPVFFAPQQPMMLHNFE